MTPILVFTIIILAFSVFCSKEVFNAFNHAPVSQYFEKYTFVKELYPANNNVKLSLIVSSSDGSQWVAKAGTGNNTALTRELILTLSTNSPYLIKAKEGFSGDEETIMILPFYSPGDSFALFLENKSMNASNFLPPLRQLVIDIIHGLVYMHSQMKLIHGDIKPENIFVSENGRFVLADFGQSFSMETPLEVGGGTPPYASPEQSACSEDKNSPLCAAIDGSIDYYALGSTVWAIAESFFTNTKPLGKPQYTTVYSIGALKEDFYKDHVDIHDLLYELMFSERRRKKEYIAAIAELPFFEGKLAFPEDAIDFQPRQAVPEKIKKMNLLPALSGQLIFEEHLE